MANEATARRINENVLGKLVGPAVMLAGVAWIVHLARPSSGTMLDDDNIGPTVVLGAIALLVVVAGAFLTRYLLRTVTLEGPCPACGVVAARDFDKPADPKSRPTACGSCIAYLRGTGDVLREEAIEAVDMIYVNYELTADQYEPADNGSSDRYFTFIMPTMCAVCGDPHAAHHRKIGSSRFTEDPFEGLNKGHVFAPAGTIPHKRELSEGEKRDEKLSKLRVPVCDKHTEKAAFGEALECF
ncbi:MAG TPA: hypothetical protein VIV58_13550, partial [Kofleriaceae bacterium]